MNSLQNYIALLPIAFEVTAPIFLLICLGAWLTYKNFINQEFIRVATKLIFNIGLPVMLFINTATRDFTHLFNLTYIALIFVTTVFIFFLSSLTAHKFIAEKSDKGVFVQGAFRGNLIIIGLAFCANAYPDNGIALAALPSAVIIITYNLLSIYTLNASLNSQTFSLKKNLQDIVKNPLIIGITAGLIVNFIKLPIPTVFVQSGSYLGQMTLPLALLAIGGSLNFSQLKSDNKSAIASSIIKVIVCPLVFLLLITFVPIDPTAAGVLFFLVASPTATASFIMVKAMNGNSTLAAKIIIISTLMSIITVTFGYATLVSIGLVK